MTPEEAERIRDRIRAGEITFEQVCDEIDGRTMRDTMRDVRRELREHDQGGAHATLDSEIAGRLGEKAGR